MSGTGLVPSTEYLPLFFNCTHVLYLTAGVTDAVFKRWIPNTNFENSTNWFEQRVPCSQDQVIFAKNKGVSVFVQSTHSLTDLHLPLDGEFILSHGAGFASASRGDPACGQGSFINFRDADQYQWFDPTLWQSALSTDDLENCRFLFAVDAERVPCQHDEVIFSPETSFRIQVKETSSEIKLGSVSVLGKKFTTNEEFAQYVQSHTGKLQFPGSVLPHVTNMKCQDPTGCVCNNIKILQEICSVLLQHTGNLCPEVSCTNPLHPVGQCCGLCGAIISLEYTSDFNLDTYRNRLIHTFLNLAKYATVELAISKVEKAASVLGIIPLGSELKIQIVIKDKEGSLAGAEARHLAYDIMSDIEKHGQSFGITKADMQFSTGTTASAQQGSMTPAAISGIVIGIVLAVSLVGFAIFLYRIDAFRYFRLFLFWRGAQREEASVQYGGFENPIFEPAAENMQVTPVFYTGEDELKEMSLPQSGPHFSNPVYDPKLDV
ncbi:protein amnionless [Mixophyes fleayi]|uniref:protein amnionless n=1 Tax=Mixophyes fleayi TaxID=3061075 RepID=UPI003F4E242F